MKKIVIGFIVVVCLYSNSVFAQDSIRSPYKEIWVSTNFSPLHFDLTYKKQTGERTFFKLGLVNLSANLSGSSASTPTNFPVNTMSYSGGLEVGIEWRKPLAKRLTFFNGPSVMGFYQYNSVVNNNPALPNRRNYTQLYSIAVPYSLGFLVSVYRNFLAAVEIDPAIAVNYNINMNNGRRIYGYNTNFVLDNRSALISLLYRF